MHIGDASLRVCMHACVFGHVCVCGGCVCVGCGWRVSVEGVCGEGVVGGCGWSFVQPFGFSVPPFQLQTSGDRQVGSFRLHHSVVGVAWQINKSDNNPKTLHGGVL